MATEPPVPPNGAESPPPPDGPQQQPKGHISPASLAAQRNLRVAQAGAPSVSGLEALVNVSEPVPLWLSDGVSIVHPVTNQPQAVPPDEVDGYRKMGYSVPGEKEAVRRATKHHEDLEAAARRLPRNTPAEAAPSA
jgi:hypothetical protein